MNTRKKSPIVCRCGYMTINFRGSGLLGVHTQETILIKCGSQVYTWLARPSPRTGYLAPSLLPHTALRFSYSASAFAASTINYFYLCCQSNGANALNGGSISGVTPWRMAAAPQFDGKLPSFNWWGHIALCLSITQFSFLISCGYTSSSIRIAEYNIEFICFLSFAFFDISFRHEFSPELDANTCVEVNFNKPDL